MKKTSISDEKRLVRGMHYKQARTALRARDCVHYHPWHFLTVAGPSPNEEIQCIRELFRNVIITSIDLNETNLSAAIDAGADEIIHCDLFDFQRITQSYSTHYFPPAAIGSERNFDVICLDLTGHASKELGSLVKIYWKILTKQGVMIVTFSYGRDVVEAYQFNWQASLNQINWEQVKKTGWGTAAELAMDQLQQLTDDGIPEPLMARIHYALGSHCQYLWSVFQYSGKEMPMVSCLLNKWSRTYAQTPRYLKVAETDFALAVTAEPEDPSKVFACPQERILELRRSLAGTKAAITTRIRRANGRDKSEQKLLEFHPEPAEDRGSTTRQVWSEDELAKLHKDYPNHDIDADVLAKQMGRTSGALRQKAFSLGIRRGTQWSEK